METRTEEWRDIEGYEGYYQVSNFGRVRSLERTIQVACKNGGSYKLTIKAKIRKPLKMYTGYFYVRLGNKNKTIHRMVAKAFVPGYQEGKVVNHIDENKENNHAENLEWVSFSKNLSLSSKLSDFHRSNSMPVLQISADGEIIRRYESIHHASLKTGILRKHISGVCRNMKGYCTAGGYRWKFADE